MRGQDEGQVVLPVVHLRIPITPPPRVRSSWDVNEPNVTSPFLRSLFLLFPPLEMLRGVVAVATVTIQQRPRGAMAPVVTDANRREAFPSELFNSSASSVCVSFLLLCLALPP